MTSKVKVRSVSLASFFLSKAILIGPSFTDMIFVFHTSESSPVLVENSDF